jgi:hypothetical protein
MRIPPFDVHAPLLSLPMIFGTTMETIPSYSRYMSADPEIVGRWRKKLEPFEGKFKIGLVWAGQPTHGNDRRRSMRLANFAPLAQIPGIELFGIQKGVASQQIETAEFNIHDLSDELSDFSETAGVLENLDLLISVDTAVVHLAGAMGLPAWVLLPYVPDWRWLLERQDTPWYATLRLFRQKAPGDWTDVVRRVAEELATLERRRLKHVRSANPFARLG